MKILVAGGTRFFGIPMVEKLIADGHEVTIATRGRAVNPFRERTEQIIMDRSDYDSVRKALGGRMYDVIIDKIAYSSDDVKNLLENAKCGKYIQMSSCAVYTQDRKDIRETDFDPRQLPLVWMSRNENYGLGKRQAERAALEYLDDSQCVFVRYPVVLGEHDYTGRLKFYSDHILNAIPMYVDDYECAMQFIHEKEAGYLIAHLVNTDINGPVNGSAHGTITPGAIIEYIEQRTGKKAVLDQNGDPAPYNGTKADVSCNTEKAQQTGFQFTDINEWIFKLIDTNLHA